MTRRPVRFLVLLPSFLLFACLLTTALGGALAIQRGTIVVRPRFVIFWIGPDAQTFEITTKPTCSILMFNCPAPARQAQHYYLTSWHFVITPSTETGRQLFRMALTP